MQINISFRCVSFSIFFLFWCCRQQDNMQRQKCHRNRIVKKSNYTREGFYRIKVCALASCVWNRNRFGFDYSLNRSDFLRKLKYSARNVESTSFWLKWFKISNVRRKFYQFKYLTYIFFHSMNCHRNDQRNRKECATYTQFIDKNEWWLRWTKQYVETMETTKEARKGERIRLNDQFSPSTIKRSSRYESWLNHDVFFSIFVYCDFDSNIWF